MPRRPAHNSGDQRQEALDKILKLTEEGLEHGFFRMGVEITTVEHGDRDVLIDAGKMYKFRVRDLSRAGGLPASTPGIGAGSSVRYPEERDYR